MFAIELGDGAELRPLQPFQAEEFLAHMDRGREAIDPWISFATRSTDLDSARATLQGFADEQAQDTLHAFGIWLEGTLVGGVMLVRFDAEAGVCELGCWMEAAGQGRGLVTTASRHLIEWAFTQRGMHRVEWRARVDNVRSTNVARRLGMSLDGVLRQAIPFSGQRHDLEVWSLLANEWEGAR
ncbi:GNAT family N-acetyltransferase [Actinospica durhamensis]|uniref:GNAT family N-acetyltransferase n=1 Tax=Actinospica durhamensis TaxID=1508375 RepID=A0A941EYH8_9ACTN|nr:GNAT family protein [Actinospica durhamensis]MBR7838833.1 GNAT family N-acetyltransferase [Actinospica durhamensis]